MNEPKRFAAIFLMAAFTLAVYYYVSTERENFALKNGTAALTGDETPPQNRNDDSVLDSVAGDPNRSGQLKYNRIETGMTYDEVYAILQSHGTEFHRHGNQVVYQWTYATKTLLVTFRGEKVSEKRFTKNPERMHSSK